jgi:glycosyltransferase involved in cell wall biosynthesis
VGDGPIREKILEQITQLNLTDCFTCPGNMDNVAEWMQALDLFVLPSYANEGVPQSIMQAMACGVPVISTPIGSITEAVSDGETGLIVPAQNAERLADSIGTLIMDAERRKQFAANARAKAENEFGKDRMLDRMQDVFDSVLRVTAPHLLNPGRAA